MTGKTHDQIALAGGLAGGLTLQLPVDQAAIMAMGAYAVARGPDYIEPLLHVAHRTWTHYLPTGLAIAAAWFAVLSLLGLHVSYAAVWAGGILIGWSVHSLADALTDRGCWLWRRRRQVLLPDHLRIKVYTVERRRHWLTRQVTQTKRPSAGERFYHAFATLTVLVLVAVHAALLAHGVTHPPA